jgi:hypothetical protein
MRSKALANGQKAKLNIPIGSGDMNQVLETEERGLNIDEEIEKSIGINQKPNNEGNPFETKKRHCLPQNLSSIKVLQDIGPKTAKTGKYIIGSNSILLIPGSPAHSLRSQTPKEKSVRFKHSLQVV